MRDSASIRLRVVGPVLEAVSGEGHLLQALPQREHFTRRELIAEAEKLDWRLEGESQPKDAQDEAIFFFEHDL